MSILNRDANSVIRARLHTGRFKPAKKPKKDGDKSAVVFFCKKKLTVGLSISGHSAAGIFIDFKEEPKKSWDQFDEYDSQKLRSVTQTSEKTKVRRSERFKSMFLITL